MIKEYAIDPEILNNWERFSRFTDSCSVYRGRRIICYPSNWLKRVLNECNKNSNCKDREKARITEKMKILKYSRDYMIKNCTSNQFENTETWITNSINTQKSNKPFDAVLARQSDINYPFIITPSDCDDAYGSELWQSTYSKSINRNETEYLDVLSWLLNSSKDIYMIDQHFHLTDRYIRPLRKILKYIKEKELQKEIKNFQIHLCLQNDAAIDIFAHNLKDEIKDDLPADFEILLVNRLVGDLHQRLVMSEYSAIEFEHGLDIYIDGTYSQTNNITILSRENFSQLKKNHFEKEISATIKV